MFISPPNVVVQAVAHATHAAHAQPINSNGNSGNHGNLDTAPLMRLLAQQGRPPSLQQQQQQMQATLMTLSQSNPSLLPALLSTLLCQGSVVPTPAAAAATATAAPSFAAVPVPTPINHLAPPPHAADPTTAALQQLTMLSHMSALQKLQTAVANESNAERLLHHHQQQQTAPANSFAAFPQVLPFPGPSAFYAATPAQQQTQTHWSLPSLASNALVASRPRLSSNNNASPPTAVKSSDSYQGQEAPRAVISSDDNTSSDSTPAAREKYDLDDGTDGNTSGDDDDDDDDSTVTSQQEEHRPRPQQQLSSSPIPSAVGSQQHQTSISTPPPQEPPKPDQSSNKVPQQGSDKRFGTLQTQKWEDRYKELVQFVRTNGHAQVPLDYRENAKLAHWVKRQRNQYKSKSVGQRSTLTPERQQLLEDLGFCWNSHRASWEERLNQLKRFKTQMGHCNVPCSNPATQTLGIWVKCQRRQYKHFTTGKKSNLDAARVEQLNQLEFEWCRRDRYKS